MSSETRSVIDQVLAIQQRLRDQQLELQGTTVTFKVPFMETTTLDEFGDVVPQNTKDLVTQIIIDWGSYRSQLNEQNMSSEFEIPLTAKAKIRDTIPKGSLVELTYLDKNHDTVTRLFEVNGVDVKAENYLIAKTIKLVPYRL